MNVTKFIPNQIKNDFNGVSQLLKIYDELMQLPKLNSVTFDFSNNTWFEANLVTILATAFEGLLSKNPKVIIYLENIDPKVETIFMKNGFYDYYNLGSKDDVYDSTIKFKPFDMTMEEEYSDYLELDVIPKINIYISEYEKDYFKTCMQEIFQNTKMHATSKILYTCGQYFPGSKRVSFTLADLGITIGENVKRKLNVEISDSGAIDWATNFGNTTKEGNDGGIGLHMLKQYVEQNGELIIVSGHGYWQSKMGEEYHRRLKTFFNGTIINLSTNLSYKIIDNDDSSNQLIF